MNTSLICTQCGGKLSKIESEVDTYICLHCGNKQIVKEDKVEINHNYQINQNITKHIYGKEKPEYGELIAKAETYFKLKDYKTALTFFDQAVQENPANYQGWWGKVRCKFSSDKYFNPNNIHEDYTNAYTLADENIKKIIKEKYHQLLKYEDDKIFDINYCSDEMVEETFVKNNTIPMIILFTTIFSLLIIFLSMSAFCVESELDVLIIAISVTVLIEFVVNILIPCICNGIYADLLFLVDFLKSKNGVKLMDIYNLTPEINLKYSKEIFLNKLFDLIDLGYLGNCEIKSGILCFHASNDNNKNIQHKDSFWQCHIKLFIGLIFIVTSLALGVVFYFLLKI